MSPNVIPVSDDFKVTCAKCNKPAQFSRHWFPHLQSVMIIVTCHGQVDRHSFDFEHFESGWTITGLSAFNEKKPIEVVEGEIVSKDLLKPGFVNDNDHTPPPTPAVLTPTVLLIEHKPLRPMCLDFDTESYTNPRFTESSPADWAPLLKDAI